MLYKYPRSPRVSCCLPFNNTQPLLLFTPFTLPAVLSIPSIVLLFYYLAAGIQPFFDRRYQGSLSIIVRSSKLL